MNSKVEIERMEAAFKRAADKAMHGTREERAGRFILQDNAASTTHNLNGVKVKESERRPDEAEHNPGSN